MKMTRRVLALVLCLVMVLGLASTAFAAEHEHTITITNNVEGYEYTAYQIFSGDLSSTGVLSNIQWGKGVDGAALLADLKDKYDAYDAFNLAEEVAGYLGGITADDDPVAFQFAEVAADHLATASGVSTYADGKYTIDVVGDGYYLIVNNKVPEDNTDTDADESERTRYSRYMLEVVKDVQVSHKGGFPTVEKDILDPTEVKTNEAAIGEDVIYQITGTIPDGIEYYSTYYYVFTDTLSKGLTYNDDLVITVNGKDVTEYFYIHATEYDETAGTTITVGIQDLLTLELADYANVGDITANTQVILTYSAKLNENALVGKPNENKVHLEYDNNPNDDGDGNLLPPPPDVEPVKPEPTGKTPEQKVETFTTSLKIQKTDGAGKALSGAQFKLEGDTMKAVIITGEKYVLAPTDVTPTHWKLKDNTYTTTAPVLGDDPSTEAIEESNLEYYESESAEYILENYVIVDSEDDSVTVEAFVDANGVLTFTGLTAGRYTLTETTTPAGYNSIAPITFNIHFSTKTKTFSSDNAKINLDGATNTFYTTVENKAGSTLPSTGGMGTTLFYVFGTMMVLGAAVLLVTKKRMTAE